MAKVVLTLLLAALSLYGFEFQEKRYISALDMSVVAKGEADFEKERIILRYNAPQKRTIRLNETGMRIVTENSVQELDYEKNPKMRYVYLLMRAVYSGDFSALKRHFNERVEGKKRIYLPKQESGAYFSQILLKLEQKRVKLLRIEMKNGDRVSIETL